MKLPRYNASGTTGAPIQVGSNPSGDTGRALAQLGSDMMNSLNQYGRAKINQEARLRDLDIQNKKELARADVELGMLQFTSSLENRNDYGNFETEYQAKFKDLSRKAKAAHFKGDDFAHEQWEGDEKLLYVDYYKNVLSEKNKKTILVAQTNYDQNKTSMFGKIDNAKSAAEIEHIFSTWQDTSHTPFQMTMYGTSDNKTAIDALNDAKAYADDAYMLKVGGAGAGETTSPLGDKAMNWEQIAENAANPDFLMMDIDGNVLTVDDPKRKAFIKKARSAKNEQEVFFENQRKDKAFTDNQTLSNRLIAVMDTKKPDPKFVKDVTENKFISGEVKRTLISSYENTLKPDNTTKSFDTPQAQQSGIIATTLINLGIIDTQKEKQLIIDLGSKGLLKREVYEGMLETVDKNIRARNKKDANIIARNVKMITKSIGDDSLAAVFGENMEKVADMDSGDLLQKVLGADLSDKGLRAIENMQDLIEEGQKKGISIQELFDPKNPKNIAVLVKEAYIADGINDLDDAFKKSYGDTGFVVDANNNFVPIDEAFGSNAFRVDPVSFYNNYSRMGGQTVDLPTKLANETLSEYVSRNQNIFTLNTSGGTQFNTSSVPLAAEDVKK